MARLLTDMNSAHRRLLSVDAVRGLAVAAMLLVNDRAGRQPALGRLYQTLFAGPLGPPLPPWLPSAAYAVTFTAVWWLLMYLVARRGWRWSI